MNIESKKQIIDSLFRKNYLFSPDVLARIPENYDLDEFFRRGKNIPRLEKVTYIPGEKFTELLGITTDTEQFYKELKIIRSYEPEIKKREVGHFVTYFKNRYEKIRDILMNRPELNNAISIKRVFEKKPMEKVALIGMVADKSITKKGNIILELEDTSGKSIKAIINKERAELLENALRVVYDEVLGITGTMGEEVVFVNSLIFPDVPLSKELKKSNENHFTAFISDIHFGSKMFLAEDFERFLGWINGEVGTPEQKDIAKRIKYLFVIGDIVDGVGIYPEQDKELAIKDIYEQYNEAARNLSKIRNDIQLIMCGGNHDAMRLAEPQPMLDKKYARALYELPNITMVTNPAVVNIHQTESFPGFDVMMYHGYSFDYYVSTVDEIRTSGGYERADLIMKLLLQKRHLAPAHSSNLYLPDTQTDPLVIDVVPDLFVSGHIHRANIGNYRNVSTISSSCWQGKTIFQERTGHKPEPSRVPVVDLKTRQIRMMRFGQ